MPQATSLSDFPSLPPPGPIVPIEDNVKASESDHYFSEYHGGIMMVAIKIKPTLCNEIRVLVH